MFTNEVIQYARILTVVQAVCVSPLWHYSPYFILVFLFIEVSLSHTIRYTVGLLWTSDQPVAETFTAQDNTTYKHKSQTSMLLAGFEPAVLATKLPQTYTLDRAATGLE
jgi:hypothetical protein